MEFTNTLLVTRAGQGLINPSGVRSSRCPRRVNSSAWGMTIFPDHLCGLLFVEGRSVILFSEIGEGSCDSDARGEIGTAH